MHGHTAAKAIIESGQLLVWFRDKVQSMGARPSKRSIQCLLDWHTRFVVLMEPLDVAVPKFHLCFHMSLRAPQFGAALLYQTSLDESSNSTLKKCLRLAHQSTFEITGLLKVNEVLQRPSMQRHLEC